MRQSIVHLGIDYAVGREIGTMGREKLKSRRSNFKSRMKRFRRLRQVAGKKAVRILNTGLQPVFSHGASIYGLSSTDLRNMRRSSSVASNTNKAGASLDKAKVLCDKTSHDLGFGQWAVLPQHVGRPSGIVGLHPGQATTHPCAGKRPLVCSLVCLEICRMVVAEPFLACAPGGQTCCHDNYVAKTLETILC